MAAAPDIDLTAFAIDEQRLLLGFRGLKPGLQRVVRHAAHCANVLPDDDEIDSDTGCTRLELRLVAQYRTSTPVVQRAILRAAPFGRIAFANTDLSGTPDHRTAIEEAHRAVSQLLDQVLVQ